MSSAAHVYIDPAEAASELSSGRAQLVDVRETSETAAMRVEGAIHMPLSRLRSLGSTLDTQRPVYLLCRSGARSASAASQLRTLGFNNVLIVRGGIDRWMQTNQPIIRSESRVWSLERQVRAAAGSLALIGIAFSLMHHPYWLGLSIFICVGLIFSAVTDTCTMAKLLLYLPWNRSDHA